MDASVLLKETIPSDYIVLQLPFPISQSHSKLWELGIRRISRRLWKVEKEMRILMWLQKVTIVIIQPFMCSTCSKCSHVKKWWFFFIVSPSWSCQNSSRELVGRKSDVKLICSTPPPFNPQLLPWFSPYSSHFLELEAQASVRTRRSPNEAVRSWRMEH